MKGLAHSIFSIFLFFSIGCWKSEDVKLQERILELTRQFEIDAFKGSSTLFPLIDRIHPLPHFLRTKWQILHKRKDYTPHTPSQNEIAKILSNAEKFPKKIQEILQKKVLGIYLMNNLMENAVLDFIPMPDNKKLYYLLLDSSTFKMNLSEGISRKLNSIFKESENHSIEFKTSQECDFILFVLLNKLFQILDQEENQISPKDKQTILDPNRFLETPFTKGVWLSRKKPAPLFDFPNRDKLSFYSLEKKNQFEIQVAPELFKALKKTPFPSLSASISSTEDFSESMTYFHLQKKLGVQCEILIREGESMIANFNPLTLNYFSRFLPIQSIYNNP
jgi:hypothetical protein